MAPARDIKSPRAARNAKRESIREGAGLIATARKKKDPADRITKKTPAPRKKLPMFECSSCGREASSRAFTKHPFTATCEHVETTTCKLCVKKWISIQLQTVKWDKVSCPECPEIMRSGDIETHADKDVYARYEKLEKRSEKEKIPGWRWCLNPKCDEGQVHPPPLSPIKPDSPRGKYPKLTTAGSASPPKLEETKEQTTKKLRTRYNILGGSNVDDSNIFTCGSCDAKACVPCDRPAHPGEECHQNKMREKKYDAADRKMIEKVTRPCPKCSVRIERSVGCDHMDCTNCSTAFCWECNTDYKIIRVSGHAKDCKYSAEGAIDPHALLPHRLAEQQRFMAAAGLPFNVLR